MCGCATTAASLQDYEALGLPMGSSKADVKKAYRKLAMQVGSCIHHRNLVHFGLVHHALQPSL